MSAKGNKSGAPVFPTTTTAGVAGTSARVVEFPVDVRPCVVTNTSSSGDIFIKINENDASATSWIAKIPAGEAQEVSFGNVLNVKIISIYRASGSYDEVQVRGWEPR